MSSLALFAGIAIGIAYVFIGLTLLIAFDKAYRSAVGPWLGDRGSVWVGLGVLFWPVSLLIDIAIEVFYSLRGRNRRIGGAR